MKPYILGVDVGGTTIKTGIFRSDDLFLLDAREIPTRTENAGAYIISDLTESIHHQLKNMSLKAKDVQGAGIGVPGAVLDDGLVMHCANLDGWGGFYVGRYLEQLLDFPVCISNDANLAALGEYTFGGGKGLVSQFFMTLGTGIGGSYIKKGEILTGSHGAAGEIGHMKICYEEKRTCGCGKKGCLEQYASAKGLVECAKLMLLSDREDSMLRNIPVLTAKDIFDCARARDGLASKCVEGMTRILGYALADVSCLLDPDVIILGGGVSKAGDILFEPLRRYFREAAFPVCEETKINPAILGNRAGIYGGAVIVRKGE